MMRNHSKTAIWCVLFLAMVGLLGSVAVAAESLQVGDLVEYAFGKRWIAGTVVALADGGEQADVAVVDRGRSRQLRLYTANLRKIDEARYNELVSESAPKPRQSRQSAPAAPAIPEGPVVGLPPVAEMQPGNPLRLPDVSPQKPVPEALERTVAQVPDQVTIELPPASLHADRSEPLLIDATRGRVLFTVAQEEREVMSTAAVLVDLESKRFMEVGRWTGTRLRMVACNAERSVALMLSDLQDAAEQPTLTVVTGLAAGTPDASLRWPLPAGQETPQPSVRNALLTSSGVAVVQVPGKVITWDLGRKRELWTFDDSGGGIAAFSPDGRFIAMQDKSQVVVVEVSTGTLFGRVDLPNAFPAGLAFTPDGQRLAVGHLEMVRLYELSDWSQISQFDLPVTPPHAYGGSAWFDDRHLLLAGGTLIRPDDYLLAWKYEGAAWERQTFSNARHGFFATFFSIGHTPTLVVARLPHASVPKELASQRRDDLAMQRGQHVKLEIDNGESPLDAATLRSAIESFTRRIGWIPSPTGEATLQVKMEQMPARKLEYQQLGQGSRNSATFAPWKISLRLVRDGDMIWTFDFTAQYPRNPIGDLQKAVTRSEVPDLKFLERIRLQPEIVASGFEKGFGQSRLTANGIEDFGPGQ